MDIKNPTNPYGKNTFSEDVLKIEKCGPNEDYLTIIDVPGIFRNITEGVTTDKDKKMVKDMVSRYIQDQRTVILAVLPCNVDVATQEILTLAKDVDPTGDRTLGILTKADLLIEQSAKASVVGLVAGDRAALKLGYHVVTNRGGDEDDEDEDTELAALKQRKREAMFQGYPWRTLPEDRVGISALRERLSDLLGEITDRAFPELRTETRERLSKAKATLKGLGISRQTEREQQQYLVSVASSFQALIRAALNADYSAHSAFEEDDMRLITAVISITHDFGSIFDSWARKYFFEDEKTTGSPGGTWSALVHEKNGHKDDARQHKAGFTVPDPNEYPDLSQIIATDWEIEEPMIGIMEWIGGVNHRSRGQDLASVGQGILHSVFREQSSKWEKLTRQFLSRIILVVHRFILKALNIVCSDVQVSQAISSAILEDLCSRYEGGMDQAVLLVDIERQLKPYTLNHYFNQTQQKSHGKRLEKMLEEKFWDPQIFSTSKVINISSVSGAFVNKSNEEFANEVIHDSLKAYYNVAFKRFVDNVFNQAVDYKLLTGPDNPLGIFCEKWVLNLDADKLSEMVGESRRTRETRDRLQKEIRDLEHALKILL